MRTHFQPLAIMFLLAIAGSAFAAGGGSMPSSTPSTQSREPPSPEELARNAYNSGVRSVEKADELLAGAAHQADARKQEKARAKAEKGYATAMKKFASATEIQPSNYQAWNYLGYTNRKLGKFDAALAAYDRALRLKPDYAEAIEYRGHAYLGLGRLSDAKEAYLALFSGNRKLAAQLLTGMQEWIAEHRANTGGLDVDAFAAWVNERSAIASQTASLTREGASAGW